MAAGGISTFTAPAHKDTEVWDDDGSSTTRDTDDGVDPFDDDEHFGAGSGLEATLHDKEPSIGSALHASGGCTPCGFFFKDKGCKAGASCRFCHLSHERSQMKKKDRPFRPCKNRRDQYRRLATRLMEEIEANPEAFDPDRLELPDSFNETIPKSISSNLPLMKKLHRRLQAHAQLVRSVRMNPPPGLSADEPLTSDGFTGDWWSSVPDAIKLSYSGQIQEVGPWTVLSL
mmetsp:Transcript_41544/g.115542  ORF Transcript_41544/g.115542 Transcript_41544/m.115542 type:complete len:230 (-) Transcript_41544:183-872(-)